MSQLSTPEGREKAKEILGGIIEEKPGLEVKRQTSKTMFLIILLNEEENKTIFL